jgi:hypothetical protein
VKDRDSVRFFIWITLAALVVALMASYVANMDGYGPTHAQSPLPTSTWTPKPLPSTPTNTPVPPTSTNTPLPPTPTNTPMPPNTPPVVTADDSAVKVNEGQTATNTGTVSDADGDTVMLSASVGAATNHGDGTWSWSFGTSDGPAESQVVTITADDGNGGTNQTAFDVTVNNVSPTSDPGPDQTVFRNDIAIVSGTWSDPAASFDNPYSWSWDLDGDGTADSSGTASFGDSIPETASFALEGFYRLSFEVTDKDGDGGSDSLVVEVLNRPLVCSDAAPSVATLWPTNHRFVAIDVLGVTDPEGDPIAITIDSILQDEPVDAPGGGSTSPDGRGVGTATAEVRAERVGSGNGRVYHIYFTADDGHGGTCSGEVLVGVPKSEGRTPVDGGPLYDSTVVIP